MKSLNEGRKMILERRYPVVISQKVTFKPQHQKIIQTKINFMKNFEGHSGLMNLDEDLEDSTELRFSSSVVTVRKKQH